jgi:hypothetical protein
VARTAIGRGRAAARVAVAAVADARRLVVVQYPDLPAEELELVVVAGALVLLAVVMTAFQVPTSLIPWPLACPGEWSAANV